jgi:hypothetical protein
MLGRLGMQVISGCKALRDHGNGATKLSQLSVTAFTETFTETIDWQDKLAIQAQDINDRHSPARSLSSKERTV